MRLNSEMPKPRGITYHKRSRTLELTFSDGLRAELSAEYLRVFSPSAEVRGHGPGQEILQTGKEDVGIINIEPVGNYAICLHFDDGHNTGIYSWEELYSLSVNKNDNWHSYLSRLQRAGYQRDPS